MICSPFCLDAVSLELRVLNVFLHAWYKNTSVTDLPVAHREIKEGFRSLFCKLMRGLGSGGKCKHEGLVQQDVLNSCMLTLSLILLLIVF